MRVYVLFATRHVQHYTRRNAFVASEWQGQDYKNRLKIHLLSFTL